MRYLTSNLLEQCLGRLIKLKVDKRARVFTGNPKSFANECIKWPRVGWGGGMEKKKSFQDSLTREFHGLLYQNPSVKF